MALISERYFAHRSSGFRARTVQAVCRLIETFDRWQRCKQAEQALRAASDRQLRDMGIDRSEISSVVWGQGRDQGRRCNAQH